MNSYALGRIVAGDTIAARFISERKSSHYGDVHCAFRRSLQSPCNVIGEFMRDPAALHLSQDSE
ncbi:hypothetical protein [Bradyrhizobium liaoningense]